MKVEIIAIENGSTYLKKIQELGRKNSKTLGFMPEGGFIDHADKGHILAAISLDQKCVGYLMYRIKQKTNKAHIIRFFGLSYAIDGSYKGWNPYRERHWAIFINCFLSKAN
ncbi:hypothetical protein [Microcystis aeruginosa]|uniref:Similarity n=1 Tax=Microcystis aeruginosa (strain PCC 7806) TaxID=267872 RepID=A8YGZ5_MICA7|nr:hypothetical protein [Microcystis aeruginosa]UGS08819.1 hypothetical protein LRR78_22410 [Microcystis aeruginosa FACHB-905 = DIANCHI905]WKX62818.1 hypothetical protein Q3H53_002858 [Microcystis aeruginosa PCC 7806]CAO87339.1 unnamed protein product [Microcystis aeruginosa PCC 7806]